LTVTAVCVCVCVCVSERAREGGGKYRREREKLVFCVFKSLNRGNFFITLDLHSNLQLVHRNGVVILMHVLRKTYPITSFYKFMTKTSTVVVTEA